MSNLQDDKAYRDAFDFFVANNDFSDELINIIKTLLSPFKDNLVRINNFTFLQWVFTGLAAELLDGLEEDEGRVSFYHEIEGSDGLIGISISLEGIDSKDMPDDLCVELQDLAEITVPKIMERFGIRHSESENYTFKRLCNSLNLPVEEEDEEDG